MSDLTLFQLKIPQDTAVKAQKITERIRAAHAREVKALTAEMKSCADERQVARLQARWAELHDRSRRITHQNVLRYAIQVGLDGVTVEGALPWLAREGVSMGRPSRAG